MRRLILLFFFFLQLSILVSQDLFYQNDNEEENNINANSDSVSIQNYLRSTNALAIEFDNYDAVNPYYKIQAKNGRWTLFNQNHIAVNQKAYDFIKLPSAANKYFGFTLARKKGKEAVLMLNGSDKVKFKYKKIIYVNEEQALDSILNNDSKFAYVPEPILLAKKRKKWGRLSIAGDEIFISEPFIFNEAENVPKTNWKVDQLEEIVELRKKERLDLIKPLPHRNNYLKGRHKRSKKWGLYFKEDNYFEVVPPEYDSILIHQHEIVYEVWKEGKVGFYNNDGNLVQEAIFDDFKFISLSKNHASALKLEGNWQLYHNYENRKLFDLKAEDLDVLIKKWQDLNGQ
ncbi:MAG: hypothetical protein ACQETL_05050 [Bacteroidota bacterium]